MKIGILNLVVDTNYGGNLQRFALCRVLQRLGHEVQFIRINRKKVEIPLWKKLFVYTKRIIKKISGQWPKFIRQEFFVEKEYSIQMEAVNSFITRYIPCYKKIFQEDDPIIIDESEFDAIVVGSDQVWRGGLGTKLSRYFFDFLSERSHVRRIVYAASFGNGDKEYSKKQIEQCGALYSKISNVSVRENEGLATIAQFGWLFPKAPKIVLDPTLLLEKQDYLDLIDGNDLKRTQNKIFCYVLDMTDEIKSFFNRMSVFLKKDIVVIDSLFPNIEKKSFASPKRIPSIENWLGCIANADFVITDSFHGTMFSIIFNKPFFTIANKNRGVSRYSYIFKSLSLEKQLIDLECDPQIGEVNIDWQCVNKTLDWMRRDSMNFLRDSLL